MKPIPVICHPSQTHLLEKDLTSLFRKHPHLSEIIYIGTSSLSHYERDIQRISQQWQFTRYSESAQTYPPPDARRIVIFNKFFSETEKQRLSTLLHEIGHYSVYDSNQLQLLQEYIEYIDLCLNTAIVSQGSYGLENPIIRFLLKDPDSIKSFAYILKLPGELGADFFVEEIDSKLFIWRLHQRVKQNISSFLEAKKLLEDGNTPTYLGANSVNRIVRFRGMLKAKIPLALKRKMRRICKIHQDLLRDSLTIKGFQSLSDLFNLVEVFAEIVPDNNKANTELVPAFEDYISQYGDVLLSLPISQKSLTYLDGLKD